MKRIQGDTESTALGRLVREAWSEGPQAPSPELLISGLRPQMARVDTELAGRSSAVRVWSLTRQWLRPLPVAAAVAGAAALLALAILPGKGEQAPTEMASEPSFFGSPAAIYDLDQGETPVMIFEADGATVIWLLEDDRISQVPRGGGVA